VLVDAWTYEVLSEAQTLSERSGGVFDITVASKLVAWDFLPRQPWNGRSANATWRDIELLPGDRVRFRRNLALDLGGIAKGFAVDKAVEALQAAGIESGIVNAGGDLRVFGSCVRTVHVRRPDSPTRFLLLDDFLDESVATSAPYFSLHRHGDRDVSPLINPTTGRPVTSCISVSVRAPRCIHADALTKVVLADPDGSVELLRSYGARAYMLSPSSREVETL
jgi:thiamine biosynthesis lipoprotein